MHRPVFFSDLKHCLATLVSHLAGTGFLHVTFVTLSHALLDVRSSVHVVLNFTWQPTGVLTILTHPPLTHALTRSSHAYDLHSFFSQVVLVGLAQSTLVWTGLVHLTATVLEHPYSTHLLAVLQSAPY